MDMTSMARPQENTGSGILIEMEINVWNPGGPMAGWAPGTQRLGWAAGNHNFEIRGKAGPQEIRLGGNLWLYG